MSDESHPSSAGKLPAEPSKFALPAPTAERWRAIVIKASRSGTDIAQLVQHFAEQSFQNKMTLLETQGARRRALANMLATVERERQRARGVLPPTAAASRSDKLAKPFVGVRIEFVPPDPARRAKRREGVKPSPMGLIGEEHNSKVTPLAPVATATALAAYVDALTAQAEQVQKELAQLDGVLNRGMRNHQAVVEELSATSRELYRIAQETLASLPAAPTPTPQPMASEDTKTHAGAAPDAAVAASAATPPPTPMAEEATASQSQARGVWNQVLAALGKGSDKGGTGAT